MKLGQLKTAIKDHEGAPTHWCVFRGKSYLMTAQKGSMLSFLDEAFPEGRSVETGLTFKDGIIQPETNENGNTTPHSREPQPELDTFEELRSES